MRREERVTVQGPVKEQQPDGMSHRGPGPAERGRGIAPVGVSEGYGVVKRRGESMPVPWGQVHGMYENG